MQHVKMRFELWETLTSTQVAVSAQEAVQPDQLSHLKDGTGLTTWCDLDASNSQLCECWRFQFCGMVSNTGHDVKESAQFQKLNTTDCRKGFPGHSMTPTSGKSCCVLTQTKTVCCLSQRWVQTLSGSLWVLNLEFLIALPVPNHVGSSKGLSHSHVICYSKTLDHDITFLQGPQVITCSTLNQSFHDIYPFACGCCAHRVKPPSKQSLCSLVMM